MSDDKSSITATEQYIRSCRADFRNFLYVVWKHLNLPDPTPAQYEIAYHLQYGSERTVINAFRGVGKSWITSAFVAWTLLKDPNENVLVVSASKDRSDQFSAFTKRLIMEMPVLAHLRPEPGGNERWSSVMFDVRGARNSHSPSVKAAGITGQITGSRAGLIVADDVETLNNSLTQTMRERISEAVKEFDSVIKPEITSRIVYLGTPQLEDSLYNRLPDRGYQQIIWPARVPKKPSKYHGKLAPSIQKMIDEKVKPGTSVDPQRFNETYLVEKEASLGKSTFALQFMMDTSLSDLERFPLKLKDLMVYSVDGDKGPINLVWGNDPSNLAQDLSPPGLSGDLLYYPIFVSKDFTDFSGTTMFVDPAGGSTGKDETALAVVKYLHGWLYVVAVEGWRDGYAESTLEAIALTAKEHSVNLIVCEENMGAGMFAELLKPVVNKIHPCTVENERSSGQKERRICDTLEPVMNRHKLVIDKKVAEKDIALARDKPAYSLLYQMTRITRDRGALQHDDKLDALTGAVSRWVEYMARDAAKAEEDWKREERERQIDEWIEAMEAPADGFSRPRNTWIIKNKVI